MALSQETLYDCAQESLQAIRRLTDWIPEVGIVLGTGLGGLVAEIDVIAEIPYEKIPHFPPPTVLSHEGRLIFGHLGKRRVVAMQGRFHLYEGYTPLQVTFPIRVLHLLGAKQLFLSNACGGMNPRFRERDLMIISDHIHLQGANPLVGWNDERFGPRFVDLLDTYDPDLRKRAATIAREEGIPLQEGIYSCVAGPNLESRAEYRMLRWTGADVVGMSTVPEVLVARHMSMKVFACSVVTDLCLPDALEVADISKIIAHAEAAEPRLTRLMARLIREQASA
jgi:purine-nucleoside phosphorylase